MKRKYGFVAILLLVLLLLGMLFTNIYVESETPAEENRLTVVTSFYPMYVATLNVVDEIEGVSLESLSEPQTGCMHDYQLTPEDMKLLSTADVFIVNGGGIEGFLADVAATYPDLVIIESCEELTLLDETEDIYEGETEVHNEHAHEETAEDSYADYVHGTRNAHAWMSVADYMTQVDTIAAGLARADVRHAAEYEQNAQAYLRKLVPLEEELAELKVQIDTDAIISFHESYDYIARDLDLDVVFTMNLDEERQVSAGEVAKVIDEIHENGVTVILAEELYGKDLGDTVLQETDAQVVYLNTLVSGEYEKDSYIRGMTENIRLLKEALIP